MRITQDAASNQMPITRVEIPGTQVVTAMVAFEAGARMESARENGIAHFLEHMVFKGGEKFPGYRDVNIASENLGCALNASTSHSMVRFHITGMAANINQMLDLLTDFVGRPHLSEDELETEKGVILQEINRAKDQPATQSWRALDELVFGDHPMGRPVLGTPESIKAFNRESFVAFKNRTWAPQRGALILAGNLSGVDEGVLSDCVARFAPVEEVSQFERVDLRHAGVKIMQRDSNQSHLSAEWSLPNDLDYSTQVALNLYATILGGSMGSRLFDEIREQRGLCYSISSFFISGAEVSAIRMRSGLESASCAEAFGRVQEIMRECQDPTPEEFLRAKSYLLGARARKLESAAAVAGDVAGQMIVDRLSPDVDRFSRVLSSVSLQELGEAARLVSSQAAISCVGPNEAADFQQ